jgi:hypothetical protein
LQALKGERRLKRQQSAIRIGSDPIKILGALFEVFKWLFKWVVVGGVVIILVLFVFNRAAFSQGLLGEGTQLAGQQLQKAPTLVDTIQDVGSFLRVFRDDPGKAITQEALRGGHEIKKAEKRRRIFIDKINFRSFDENELVYGTVEVTASNLGRDTEAMPYCRLEIEKGKYTEDVNKDALLFKKDIPNDRRLFTCNFPENSKYEESNLLKGGLVKVSYSDTTTSTYKIYYTDSDSLSEASKLIRDSDYNSNNGKVKTVQEDVRTVMGIGFDSSYQPVTTDRDSRLIVAFEKEKDVGIESGLVKVNNLNIEVPPIISFVEDDTCDFRSIDSAFDGNTVYSVRREILDRVNVDCSRVKESYRDECVRKYKEDLRFSCGFNINGDVEGEIPEFVILKGVSNYDFEVVKKFSVLIGEPLEKFLPEDAFEEEGELPG